ncbi:MAG: ATP-binding protein [Candidatus Riflebacteria bacterium HGW-Riflebacteria-1]|nr:MAG: ATP-binding protein [Candidatus Riflebacteria bacterium HGW-Riflebacteria-1]
MSNNSRPDSECTSRGPACKSCSSTSCRQKADETPQESLNSIKHTIVVMSGKGGVGKSTVAVNLAVALAAEGHRTGLLDIDIHGPSVPTMLKLQKERTLTEDGKILPLTVGDMKVMSIGFLLENHNDAIIWRGPLKAGVIGQFLTDVNWGELDYLIVDAPPGTGDEPLSIFQQLKGSKSALIVTTPQEVAAADVRKSINFCRQLGVEIAGIVENMSGFVCPSCNCQTAIFNSGGGEKTAAEFNVRFLGKIPIEPAIGTSCDTGMPYVYAHSNTQTAKILTQIVAQLVDICGPAENTGKAAA